MKLYKLASIALLGSLFTACSDCDSFNTAEGVSVEMEETTFSTRENGAIFNIPVKVVGEANGKIVVNVITEPVGAEPAKADDNYIVTSYSIIIPEGETTGNIEIRPIDNPEENDPRTFNVIIASAQGAQVGALASTEVTLRDNDQDPYEKLCGPWVFNGTSLFTNGQDGPMPVNIETPDPETEAEYYGHELYCMGMKGGKYFYLPLNFEYDELNDEVTLSIQTGTFCTFTTINFGFTGVIVGSSAYSPTSFGDDIPLTITMDGSNIVKMEADPRAQFFFKVLTYPALAYAGYWDGWDNISLVRE